MLAQKTLPRLCSRTPAVRICDRRSFVARAAAEESNYSLSSLLKSLLPLHAKGQLRSQALAGLVDSAVRAQLQVVQAQAKEQVAQAKEQVAQAQAQEQVAQAQAQVQVAQAKVGRWSIGQICSTKQLSALHMD